MATSSSYMKYIILLINVAVALVAADDRPYVTTPTAKILGKWQDVSSRQVPEMDQKMAVYSRIPFAEPPVGDLRFKAPVPATLTGDFEATRPGIACPQAVADFFPIGLDQSEDCLYLDVFVPARKPSPAAVMVWIHGGAYSAGAGSMEAMLPIALAAVGEVIIVTTNYRLNVLGFLSTGDEEVPGNMGLLDQRQALVWVQENIAAFGGDPNRVTIFGESAGSGSVNLHLFSPMSSPLFHRAIMQSGALNQAWTYNPIKEAAVKTTFEFGRGVGCDHETSTELVQCLRGKPVEDFVEYLQKAINESRNDIFFNPVVDGSFLPDDPHTLLSTGSFSTAEVINGYLAEEGTLFWAMMKKGMGEEDGAVNSTAFHGFISASLQTTDRALVDSTTFVYKNPSQVDDPNADHRDSVRNFLGDTMFACSANAMTRGLAEAGRSVYSYFMTHVPSTSIWRLYFPNVGATHAEDLPFTLGFPLTDNIGPEEFYYSFEDVEVSMSMEIMRYWSNFARTGDPNQSPDESGTPRDEYPAWPKSTVLDPMYKEFSSTFANREGFPRAKECFYWEKIFPTLMQNFMELAGLKSTLEENVEADSGKSCTDPDSCPEN